MVSEDNTIIYRRRFERSIRDADQKVGAGEEVALAIMLAAIAAARRRIGKGRVEMVIRDFLGADAAP